MTDHTNGRSHIMKRLALVIGATAAIAVLLGPTAQAAYVDGTDLSPTATLSSTPGNAPVLITDFSAAIPGTVVQQPTVDTSPGVGFDWGDAAIGALGGSVLVLLAAGIALLVLSQRTGTRIALH